MAEKELTNEEAESFRKELAEIKADMMRKELEEIKKERMRKELEEIKAERAYAPPAPARTVYVQAPAPALSLPNLIFAALMLLIAGYLIGTIYHIDFAGSIDSAIQGLSLPFAIPFGGAAIVAVLALVLAAFGVALVTIARK
jgi:hypothetical protein